MTEINNMSDIKNKVRNEGNISGKQREDYISSLITTIESQKEKITDLESLIEWWEERASEAKCMAEATDKENIELKRQIESQKEEIEQLKSELVSIGKVADIGLKKNDPYDIKLALQAIQMAVDDINE